MNGSAYDLATPRGTLNRKAIRRLDQFGRNRKRYVLSQEEVESLEENARLVAAKYWGTKSIRTSQSVQNQLNRGRWHYIDQAPYAVDVLIELAKDAAMNLAYYP